MELTNFYSLMPQKNCGICGYSKCTTFARHILFKGEDVRQCLWLDEPLLYDEVKPVKTRVNQSALLQPCITDGEKVMAEMYLAAREVDYGYLDPQFCEYVNLYFTSVKCSKSLGIARIEYENKEILLSQTGKVVVRQAGNEEDALRTVELVHRVVSGALICSSLSTALESISGLYPCESWVKAPSAQERELLPLVWKYETSALKVLTTGKAHVLDVNPLKSTAVTLLAENRAGLTLYALADHLSCMQSAATDAASYHDQLPQDITDFVYKACADSHSLQESSQVLTRLNELSTNPFHREVFKVVFHALCIGKIRERFSL